ncbi:hypothetical protein M441DRAFT_52250 [Trichoderma asperellum CBS 433.97]|uniref:Uncharacterized protein n=1 Tax=Trichoderma asperellum (strain ATCC 204424 / CBS 433.97 / NBRC 101777) TaxID=1042311 RepID=A0A2T3YRW7_TRIA4|nr:hypothetical protein M441DRAFT_52250 [Trichoderma asperellum CBS 433.97]PTB35269.1 hypothetical protein M441DRAFT_52250 [Trichoderma asperellum CBS 433.97]
MQDFPTHQDVVCKTPENTKASQNLSASKKAQQQDSKYGPARGAATNGPGSVSGIIDEGPFRPSPNQSSAKDPNLSVKASLEAETDDNGGEKEEEELGFKDASSFSSRLQSPTHVKTNEIGYKLASFYATKIRFADRYDILVWMTGKHLGDIEGRHLETMENVFRIISLLRHRLGKEEGDLPIYRFIERLRNPVEHPAISQILIGLETVSEEIIEELLAPGDEGSLSLFLVALEDLASDSQTHEFLQRVMPRIIEKCDGFQQTESNLAIHSRCILAEILVDSAQHERAKSVLRGTGRPLKNKVDSKSLLELPTINLVRRVAITFLRANDLEMCDKVIKRVVAIFDTGFAAEKESFHYLILIDFLISTTLEIQKRYEWERSRPWVERALSLSYSLFGLNHSRTKRIEKMLETHKVEQLFSVTTMRALLNYLCTSNTSNA